MLRLSSPNPCNAAPIALALVLACGTLGCAKHIDDRESGTVDFSNPKRVLSSVFHAAKTGEADHLASLCDPKGGADEDVRRLCSLTPDSPDWQSFVRHFQNAHLIGEARISGRRALVNFAFGPEGKQSETMELRQRGGRWYLHEF